jgi:hypothetical protein
MWFWLFSLLTAKQIDSCFHLRQDHRWPNSLAGLLIRLLSLSIKTGSAALTRRAKRTLKPFCCLRFITLCACHIPS